jgi:hypothetical protein
MPFNKEDENGDWTEGSIFGTASGGEEEMKRILLLILVIGILLLSACTAPTPTPTFEPLLKPDIESQTYTNSVYGFSVEYPKGWDILEDYMGTVVLFAGPMVLKGSYYVNVAVRVVQLPQDMTLKDIVKSGELTDKRSVENYKKLEEQNTIVGGLPANVQTSIGTMKVEGEDLLLKDSVVRLVKDKVCYIITYDVPDEFHYLYAECFLLVISTFDLE